MTKKEKALVADVVACEEFDYGMVYYSDFSEIKDRKFHDLLFNFKAARQQLIDYCELEDM